MKFHRNNFLDQLQWLFSPSPRYPRRIPFLKPHGEYSQRGRQDGINQSRHPGPRAYHHKVCPDRGEQIQDAPACRKDPVGFDKQGITQRVISAVVVHRVFRGERNFLEGGDCPQNSEQQVAQRNQDRLCDSQRCERAYRRDFVKAYRLEFRPAPFKPAQRHQPARDQPAPDSPCGVHRQEYPQHEPGQQQDSHVRFLFRRLPGFLFLLFGDFFFIVPVPEDRSPVRHQREVAQCPVLPLHHRFRSGNLVTRDPLPDGERSLDSRRIRQEVLCDHPAFVFSQQDLARDSGVCEVELQHPVRSLPGFRIVQRGHLGDQPDAFVHFFAGIVHAPAGVRHFLKRLSAVQRTGQLRSRFLRDPALREFRTGLSDNLQVFAGSLTKLRYPEQLSLSAEDVGMFPCSACQIELVSDGVVISGRRMEAAG